MLDQQDTIHPATSFAGRGPNPTGGRRRDADYYAAQDRAAVPGELPTGADRFAPVRLLRRNGLARHLGWPSRIVDHLELLVSWTAPVDWKPGNLRIVWHSVAETAQTLGISEEQVRRNERRLMELGAIAWSDSSNYRRDGRRDKNGRILWAYGVDLGPLAGLIPQLQRQADIHLAALEEHRDHRSRLSRARRHSRDALVQAVQDGRIPLAAADLLSSHLQDFQPHCPAVRIPLQELKRLCEAAERFERGLMERIRDATAPEPAEPSDSTNLPAPADPRCLPESITNRKHKYEVVAAKQANAPSDTDPYAARQEAGKGDGSPAGQVDASTQKGPPDWLILETLSPRIATYLPADRTPGPRDLYEAANLSRCRMGISPHAWGEACKVLTRVGAALAVVIIASRLDAEEIRSPGGYLRGLTEAAREGRFDMARSLWGVVHRTEQVQQDHDFWSDELEAHADPEGVQP